MFKALDINADEGDFARINRRKTGPDAIHCCVAVNNPSLAFVPSLSLRSPSSMTNASIDFPVPPFALNDALLFVTTVASGSFTAAAERHGITPPA